MPNITSPYEPTIREHLHKLPLSASHAFEHIDLVLSYALGLQATYGGDLDVVTAAALLHDLGRSDPPYRGDDNTMQSALTLQQLYLPLLTQYRGDDSTMQSVESASSLLEDIKFPPEKIPQVLKAIAEHDKPSLRPSTLEGHILKDADFLAGFGAAGIARSAMWTGETGGSMDDLFERLEFKMPARLASLEFEQSRYHAMREYVFVRLFIDKLKFISPLTPLPPVPYVVIEGISGSGKSTQMEMLNNHYRKVGYMPVTLHEPTPWYSQIRSTLDASQCDNSIRLLLLLTDRYLNVRKVIQDALAQDNPVISDRSYLSSMVYQAGEGWLSAPNIAYLHTILPQPTHIFLLDTTAQEAMYRIEKRTKEKNLSLGEHETLEQLAIHRQRFLSLVNFFPHMDIIDTQKQEPYDVHKQIWAILKHQTKYELNLT